MARHKTHIWLMQAARAASPAQLRQSCSVELVATIGKHLTRSDNEGAESYDRVAVVLCADNVTGNIVTCALINLAIHETGLCCSPHRHG